jgi:molybdopterin molybdotransferase
MVLFEEALLTVLNQKVVTTIERVAISDSPGRILAEDIFSDMDMPPFDKSAVDGYACCSADFIPGGGTATLTVMETIPAGKIPQHRISSGSCSKIMTGGMVPEGADCIVMVEDSEPEGDTAVRLVRRDTQANICYRAEDITSGSRVLTRGDRLMPAHIAVLASVGAVNPLVAKLPRVGIISTGDELVEPGETPVPGKIRNSNAWQLEAQVRSVPARPVYYGIIPDESAMLRETIERALSENDVVLLTGGVSMGDFDFVPEVMKEAGIELFFTRVAVQPGKPTVFGRRENSFIFGLPGNPVSSYVIFEMLVRPFIHKMTGCTIEPMLWELPLGIDFFRRKTSRKSMVPVTIREGAVFPVEYHGSAHINAYTAAIGMMIVEIGIGTISKGERVHVRPL